MKIIHVTLGNPKAKQGGLSRYCDELMQHQRNNGHHPILLYPGTFINSTRPTIICKRNNEYEILDALPVPITYGINNPESYMISVNMQRYGKWLDVIKPDIIHVHSIQGIHKEFFEAAEIREIPIVFTTHDYFPLCFRCTLLDNSNRVCETQFVEKCVKCNQNQGLPLYTQRLLQSDLYQKLKDINMLKKIKKTKNYKVKRTNDKIGSLEEDKQRGDNRYELLQYDKLKKYYSDIMEHVSVYHCNSRSTFSRYREQYPNKCYEVIPITHCGLERSVHVRKKKNVLNISYMGGMSTHKGYQILMDAIEKLEEESSKWQLWLYGGEFIQKHHGRSYHYKGFFEKSEEEEVWANTDLLVVPSQCPETFGFIVLEGLCRGIPVICSDLVGSRDLLEDINPNLVFHHDDVVELAEKIGAFFNDGFYYETQTKIKQTKIDISMELHAKKIFSLYRRTYRRDI